MRMIYRDDRVAIGDSIAILDGVAYPISAIASVEAREIKAKVGFTPIICFALGAPLSFSATGHALHALLPGGSPPIDRETARLAIGFAVLGGALVIGGLLMLGGRSTYALVISTSAGERAALKAKDAAYIGRLRAAIEEALLASR